MSVQCVAWLAVFGLANLPAVALAQSSSCPGMHVQVLNIRNSTGTVDCALFESPQGFPTEALRSATNVMVIKGLCQNSRHLVFSRTICRLSSSKGGEACPAPTVRQSRPISAPITRY